MTYLASPYSHPEAEVMERRFNQVCYVAGAMMASGELVYSPIAHTHPIAVRCELPRGWDFWERFDRRMLSASSRLLVVKMSGWEESKGIAGEIAIAKEMGIPVEYLDYEKEGA